MSLTNTKINRMREEKTESTIKLHLSSKRFSDVGCFFDEINQEAMQESYNVCTHAVKNLQYEKDFLKWLKNTKPSKCANPPKYEYAIIAATIPYPTNINPRKTLENRDNPIHNARIRCYNLEVEVGCIYEELALLNTKFNELLNIKSK